MLRPYPIFKGLCVGGADELPLERFECDTVYACPEAQIRSEESGGPKMRGY